MVLSFAATSWFSGPPGGSAMNGVVKLHGLGRGDRGTICEIGASGISAKRLADLGFVRGARVEMIRTGAPCLVRLEGTLIGLGAGHQEQIEVAR